MNVVELLSSRDHPAIIAPNGTQITFQQLHKRVGALAGGLVDLGVRPGDRIVVLIPMSIDLYVVLLALFHIDATAVLIDPSAPVQSILNAHRPAGLIASPLAHALRLRIPALRGLGVYISTGFVPLPHLRLSTVVGVAPSPRTPQHPALLTFTTGTTGMPKAMARSHDFLLQQHRILKEHMDLGPADVDMPTLPVFLLHSLAGGACCALPDANLRRVADMVPQTVANQLRAMAVTSLSGSPAFLTPLAEHLLTTQQPNHTVRRIDTGGARVSSATLRALCDAFPKAQITVLYGSTEAEPIALLDARENVERLEEGERSGRGALVGHPVAAISIRIVDDEIWVSGPHVNTQYHQNPVADAENKVHEGGRIWHRTGDAGFLDNEGQLWLLGRWNARVAGYWPVTVEAPVEQLPFVRRAALVAFNEEAVVICELEDPPQDWQQQVHTLVGLPSQRIAHMPVDPRHNAKIDRAELMASLNR